MTTECALASAKQLRLVITTLCFGGVLLWILSGQYLDRDEALGYAGPAEDGQAELAWRAREWSSQSQLPRSHLRKLLETAGGDGLDGTGVSRLHNDSGLVESGDLGYNTATAQCSDVHKLRRNESKCTYVKTVDSCQNDDGLLNYLNFIYCTMPSKLIPLALVLLFFWLVFLFIFLGATAEEYFCPSLTVMSQVLHLSQNVAGVTLLALGNGAPDIFSAFAAISQKDDHKSSLAIGALFGAGIFVTTIVVGAVALLTPFELTKRPFLRDIIFYTVAVYWTFYLLWTNTVDIYNATGFIALYVLYVAVVIVGRAVYQRWRKRKRTGKPQSDIARKPRSPTGEELGSSSPVLNGTVPPVMNGALPIATPAVTKTPARVSGSQFSSTIPPIPEEEEDEEKERDEEEAGGWLHHVVHLSDEVPESEPQTYSGGAIQVTSAEESEQGAVLPGRSRLETPPAHPSPAPAPTQQQANREELFSGGSAHPLFPQIGAALLSPGVIARKGQSVSPPPDVERAWGYSQRRIVWDELERPRSASPRKLMRKTLSGALDITEEVGAAVGIPHVPQIWEEVHRVHHRKSKSPAPDRSYESEREESGRGREEEKEEEEEEEEDETTPFLHKKPKRPHPFLVLLRALWPFGEDFKQLGITGKIYEIVKYPCTLILTLTVPVIDHEADLDNWNRWLNILHCVTGPMVVAVFTKRGLYLISGVFPIWTLVLVLSTLVAIVVACTSRNDKKPVYHCVFAWVGFAVSVVWIYCIANEIVNLLQAFGIVIKLSDGILGITLLAWGNSIGDAVSNLTMARQGFPRMALGACFGGPLLNMLIGIGVASVYKSIKRSSNGFKFTLYFTQVEFFAAVFLIVSLALSLAVISFLRFRLRRPYGVFLIVFYVVFLVVAIVAETQVFTISISGVLSKE